MGSLGDPTISAPPWSGKLSLALKAFIDRHDPGVIKLFSCSGHLRLKFILLINVKMQTTVGILTLMRRTRAGTLYRYADVL